MTFTFTVRGCPRPQPRPRFIKGRVVSTASPKAKHWRLAIERTLLELIADGPTPIFTEPFTALMHFRFATANADLWGREHAVRPDVDNLQKLAADVMERAGLIANDKLMAEVTATKHWCRPGQEGVTIAVEPFSDRAILPPCLGPQEDDGVPGWMLKTEGPGAGDAEPFA